MVVGIKNVANNNVKTIHMVFSEQPVPRPLFETTHVEYTAYHSHLMTHLCQVTTHIIAAGASRTFICTKMLMYVDYSHRVSSFQMVV